MNFIFLDVQYMKLYVYDIISGDNHKVINKRNKG